MATYLRKSNMNKLSNDNDLIVESASDSRKEIYYHLINVAIAGNVAKLLIGSLNETFLLPELLSIVI